MNANERTTVLDLPFKLNRILCVSILLAAAGAMAAVHAASHATLYPFGMCSNSHFLSANEYKIQMLAAGARICRDDNPFSTCRSTADPDPAHWKWDSFDGVRRIKRDYPQLDWLPILGYEPKWAQSMDFAQASQSYGQYVYEAVKRYKPYVHYWESWNEPDLPGHAFFRGNGKDFFPYQKACYLSAKKADPDCTVVFAGMCFANIEGCL